MAVGEGLRSEVRAGHYSAAYHSLKADPVEVLRPVIPHDIGRTAHTGATPVLNLSHLPLVT